MQIKENGIERTVLTTDSWANGHIASYHIDTLTSISSMPMIPFGQEGQILMWKNGSPVWVTPPSNFQMYLALAENEASK